MNRKSLVSSILAALHAVNPFSSNPDKPNRDPKRNSRKAESQKHYPKPPTKVKFKQNQRKQRNASARKKAKH